MGQSDSMIYIKTEKGRTALLQRDLLSLRQLAQPAERPGDPDSVEWLVGHG